MILTHLVVYRFLRGASPVSGGTGFKGVLPLGYYALMRKWKESGIVPPVDEANSLLPLVRRRRR